ncbi:MAG TPA: hypothetical protein VIV55_13265 [Flavobacterium sp.]
MSRETLLRPFSKADFDKPHVQILFISGGKDKKFPPELIQKITQRYTDTTSRIDVNYLMIKTISSVARRVGRKWLIPFWIGMRIYKTKKQQ